MDQVAGSGDARDARGAEVPEEPQDQQDDDEELQHERMKARFADWVATADAVRATAKKLEKHAALAGYLSSLEDADLEIAARLLAGAPFPRKDERVLSVGWSALSDVLLERSGKNGEDMAASYQRHADLGDVAGELIGDTALRAKHGTLDEPTLAHFRPIGMMLATPVLQLEEVGKRFPAPYVVEDKYDGIRAQVHKAGDRVELYSRTFDRITNRYPELSAPLLRVPGSYVIDGEVLAFAEGKAVPFTDFQTRLGRKNVADELRTRMPSSLVAFDIIQRDGRALLDAPLAERQEILRGLPLVPPVIFARHQRVASSGEELVAILEREFAAARGRGNEGLMVKDPRSPYRPGRRGMEWLKVKRALRTLDVVVTAVEWGHGKRHAVLSDYTFAIRDGERLLNIGKAYSGLTDKEIAEMTKYFQEHTVHDYGRVRTVIPDTVIEVAFDQIQPSERHESGYAMRFPRIVRLRPDKPVAEIDTLETVRQIAGR